MTNIEVLDARPGAGVGYKVHVSRGQRVGRVSSEWFSRPDDQRYLSLDELLASEGPQRAEPHQHGGERGGAGGGQP